MSNFINDETTIDFPVSSDIKYLMEECEKADHEDNYPIYENYANVLVYVISKEAYAHGHLTKKQWEIIERRYQL